MSRGRPKLRWIDRSHTRCEKYRCHQLENQAQNRTESVRNLVRSRPLFRAVALNKGWIKYCWKMCRKKNISHRNFHNFFTRSSKPNIIFRVYFVSRFSHLKAKNSLNSSKFVVGAKCRIFLYNKLRPILLKVLKIKLPNFLFF